MTPLGAFSVYWLVGQVLPADVVLGLHHKKRRSRVVYDLI
jgi:hypothetical protein